MAPLPAPATARELRSLELSLGPPSGPDFSTAVPVASGGGTSTLRSGSGGAGRWPWRPWDSPSCLPPSGGLVARCAPGERRRLALVATPALIEQTLTAR